MSAGPDSPGPQVDMANHWLLRIVAAIIDSIPWAIIGWVIWWALAFNGGAPLANALGSFVGCMDIFGANLLRHILGHLWHCHGIVSFWGNVWKTVHGSARADAQRQ